MINGSTCTSAFKFHARNVASPCGAFDFLFHLNRNTVHKTTETSVTNVYIGYVVLISI